MLSTLTIFNHEETLHVPLVRCGWSIWYALTDNLVIRRIGSENSQLLICKHGDWPMDVESSWNPTRHRTEIQLPFFSDRLLSNGLDLDFSRTELRNITDTFSHERLR
jgi:hypothetical protein